MSIRPSRHVTFVRLCRRQLHLEDEKPQKEKTSNFFNSLDHTWNSVACNVISHQSMTSNFD